MSKLMDHFKYSAQVLFGRVNAGRRLTILPDDRFLVSYPRSGSTWTRFLIGNLLSTGEPITFANVESRCPSIYICSDRQLRRVARPRLLTSHESFDPCYKTIIYVVRDPRDVAVSFYHYSIKNQHIPDNYPLDNFVSRFVAVEIDPVYDRWGSWADNVMSWTSMRQGHAGFLLLRYEDMVDAPERELAKVASLLNLDVTPERLSRAVELSSADRMRRLEKEQHQAWMQTSHTRADKPFVRAAASGTWRGVLSPAAIVQIEAAWGGAMQTLGYALNKDLPAYQLSR
jgi:Sulfotransferase domain